MKRSEIARICSFLQDQVGQNQGHPFEFHGPRTNSDLNTEVPSLFESYHGFLEALLRTPLNDMVVNLPSWSKRYWMVSQPRPRAIPQRFDYGYPQTGYWCDAFGCGAPNNFFRLVGDHPTTFYSLCLAGSDVHHIRWRNASKNDRTNDPVSMEESEFSYTQTSYQGAEWDETRRYWGKCGARVRVDFEKSCSFTTKYYLITRRALKASLRNPECQKQS